MRKPARQNLRSPKPNPLISAEQHVPGALPCCSDGAAVARGQSRETHPMFYLIKKLYELFSLLFLIGWILYLILS
ncbi:hypothetical protein [Caenispirillum bisanense]|uniref:hypothetical protein n=1 Tax=Caenispirillum bisanense TaxID=414052 RepID=UPI00114472BA|nr:hypothetical protein [Caenispirillum bisanense]